MNLNDSTELSDFLSGTLLEMEMIPINTDHVITRTLQDNVDNLEHLRAAIAAAGRKDIDDVRNYGGTKGGSLLAAVECSVTYGDLLDIIKDMRLGLAQRRVALDH